MIARRPESDQLDRDRPRCSSSTGSGSRCSSRVAALVFGTASLGDPIEDGTYVYLWLRPIRRWQTHRGGVPRRRSTLVVPAGGGPDGDRAASSSTPSPDPGSARSPRRCSPAIAYSAVFVLLGQVTQRSLVWGIAYLLIYEQFICRGGKALGFLSVHSHAVSVLSKTRRRRDAARLLRPSHRRWSWRLGHHRGAAGAVVRVARAPMSVA